MEKSETEENFIDPMFEAGAHYGYSKSTRHPSVSPYIFGTKNRVEIFDLEKTQRLLLDAVSYVKLLGMEEKKLLFVGGKSEAQDIVKSAAENIEMPYVAGRWIGGTLTNYSEIKKRVGRLLDLRSERERGELAKKYTKKEQLLIDREIAKLEEHFSGLIVLKETLPQALFIIDTKKEHTAVREAKHMNIPVIGLMNSDCNISDADYPIIANDASKNSIAFFVEKIASAYKDGLSHKAVPNDSKEEKKNEIE